MVCLPFLTTPVAFFVSIFWLHTHSGQLSCFDQSNISFLLNTCSLFIISFLSAELLSCVATFLYVFFYFLTKNFQATTAQPQELKHVKV
jgi:hypothetical protein